MKTNTLIPAFVFASLFPFFSPALAQVQPEIQQTKPAELPEALEDAERKN